MQPTEATTSALAPTYPVCGIPIAALTSRQAARIIAEAAAAGHPLQVHLCNAFTLSLVDSDEALRHALLAGDLNLPDGTPVAWLGRRHGTDGPVRGPGLVGHVATEGVKHRVRHYLYGGANGVAEAMSTKMREFAPGVEIVSCETPPFRELKDTEVAGLGQRIDSSGAQIVWVGLGTPRQDYLVPRLAAHSNAVVIPVGAAFDFWAGTAKEAPSWTHGRGIEWIHRLLSEPQRLWRRYLIGNPRFGVSMIAHRFPLRNRV